MEKKVSNNRKKSSEMVKRMVTMAMLSAIGIVLVTFIEIPLFSVVPDLKYDPADIPLLIGAMQFGPWAALAMTFVVCFVQSFMVHGAGGVVGFLMHFIGTGTLVVLAGLLYNRKKPSTINMVVSLVTGTLGMTIIMATLCFVALPIVIPGMARETVVALLPIGIIPFNLIKAGGNSILAALLLKALKPTKIFD